MHHRQDSHAFGLTIFIADSNGVDKPWSEITDCWMMVQCHGSSPKDACTVPPGACDCDGTRPDECGVCGGDGPGDGETCWFGDKKRSGVVVPMANAHLNKAYQTSGLYCLWDGSANAFASCPYRGMTGYATGHGFNGEANMNHLAIEKEGNALRVDFVKPFIGDPFCWVSFEGVWVHHRIDSFPLGVRIFLADTNGNDMDWSTVHSHVQIVCHGAGVENVEAGSFGMPSQLVIPSASSDLDKPFQLTGLYCHWSGAAGGFDNCPNAHSWAGVANMDPPGPGAAVMNAAGTGLFVPFMVPFSGGPLLHRGKFTKHSAVA